MTMFRVGDKVMTTRHPMRCGEIAKIVDHMAVVAQDDGGFGGNFVEYLDWLMLDPEEY